MEGANGTSGWKRWLESLAAPPKDISFRHRGWMLVGYVLLAGAQAASMLTSEGKGLGGFIFWVMLLLGHISGQFVFPPQVALAVRLLFRAWTLLGAGYLTWYLLS
jgi:hypothetical protein